MSLINDALKRAKAAQQPVLPAPKVDLRPVSDPAPAHKHGSRALLMAVLGVFLMATLLVIRLTGRNSSITANAASPAVATSAQPAPAPVSNPDVPQNPANAVVASPSPSA